MENFSYFVEYARGGRAKCGKCRGVIDKNLMRIARYVQSLYHDGTELRWYHVDCFFKSGSTYPESTMEIANFDNIRWEDQRLIKHQLGIEEIASSEPGCSGEPPAKKRKISAKNSGEKLMEKQNELLFAIRDKLQDLPTKILSDLLSYNNQSVPEGAMAKLDTLSDAMVFGALKRCKKCTGHFGYISSRGYRCTGWNEGGWSKCEEETQDPIRVEFVVPNDLANDIPFLNSYISKVRKRMVQVATASSSRSAMPSQLTTKSETSIPNTVKLYVKPSGVVHPESEMADIAHVYQNGEEIYSVTLDKTCIQQKKNSFYVLQILKHNEYNEFLLFRIWGRTGTDIGDKKIELLSLEECTKQFEKLYAEKTGNKWKSRKNFVKLPGKMYPVNTDYREPGSDHPDVPSILKKPIYNLMKIIFDVHTMKMIMHEYDLDLDKMPLGKISRDQLLIAHRVLTELMKDLELMKLNDNYDRVKLIDSSNKFFTLVPHCFGTSNVPILDSIEAIKDKCLMLDTLLEIEIALSILAIDINSDGPRNPLDVYYEKLKTDIEILDKNTSEYNIIRKYVKNTHGPTHNYELEIEEIFVIRREGEEERYERFGSLHNRKLLWHGSRMSNYAGILSQGLKIAPHEAPSSGYMFGKGIYFADIVTKSANYCLANRQDPYGLLLLCEVALGNMSGRIQADYITQLPDDKHSIIAHGKIQPDPNESHKTPDGIEIPIGKSVRTIIDGEDALMYNEYVVYNPDQVKIRYLVKVNFK